VRVVADTHALVWYLLDDPDRRLSPGARTALERAESITATAMALGLPLVTRDWRIRESGLVETIW
jgi:hypothetical protein